jgi:hypothetical protein
MNLTEYIRCIKSTDTLLKLNNIEGIRPEAAEAISYALNLSKKKLTMLRY